MSIPNVIIFFELYQFKRYNTNMKYLIYLLLFIATFTGCSPKPNEELKPISYGDYTEVSFESLPAWENEDYEEILRIFNKTCTKSASKVLFEQNCMRANSTANAKSFFEENFTPFKALSKNSLATGYFEPTLQGSLVQTPDYPYPVYGVPQNILHIELVSAYKSYLSKPLRGRIFEGKVLPFYSRSEIEDGVLEDTPLCYVNDKVDLFFLHVQGSGRVQLDSNRSLFLGYADQNGFPYHSIGKEMIKRGMLKKDKVSLQSIRAYLKNNPEKCDEVLRTNPSYIFFEERTQSATGSLGVVLEKERSVAVDKKNIPLGMPLYISTKDPLSDQKIQKMVFAHDTGGAIKGESRIDIFFGSSEKARAQAGQMQEQLELWMLIPNDYLSNRK